MKVQLDPSLAADIEGLVDYCQDDREWDDFREQLIDNSGDLTDEEREVLEENSNSDKAQEILERMAEDRSETHPWAIAHRIRKALGLNE